MPAEMTREEHLRWAKQRALALVERSQLQEAFAVLVSDLDKHPETRGDVDLLSVLGMQLMMNGHLNTPEAMRRWIEGVE
jgi:hypothetical protein